MSYTPDDAAWDGFYDRLSRDLYPEHREQAIEEFTTERLKSFYVKNPQVVSNAFGSYKEAKALLDNGHASASFVFAVSAIEQYLKTAVLKPVVYGLVYHEALAELIVDHTMGQSGFDRYKKLLAGLFESLVSVDLENIKRPGSTKKLLEEASDLQKVRNAIIHQGIQVQKVEAAQAIEITDAVVQQIVLGMLGALELQIEGDRKIVPTNPV